MMKSSKLVSAVLIAMATAACASVEADLDIDPACEGDDAKCDGETEGFEIFEGVDGRFYFHLVSGNGQIVLRSQSYASKQAATKGVESVRTNGVDAASYRVETAVNGDFYVNLRAGNGEIVATSETYSRRYNAKRAIDSSVRLISEAQRIRAATSGARFQTIVGRDHQSYFHLRAKNGEVMLVSEGYINQANAIKGVGSVRTSGKQAGNYTIKAAADGQFYFTLQAGNNEIIGRGETYATKDNAQRAVDTLVALLQSELVADPKPAKEPVRSLAQQTDLVTVLDGLGDIAAAGDQLAFFGFAEQASKPAGIECDTVEAAQIEAAFDGLVGEILQEGDAAKRPDLTPVLIDSSRMQLRTLLGGDTFEICEREVMGEGILGKETFILSKQSDGPRIVLETGFDAQ